MRRWRAVAVGLLGFIALVLLGIPWALDRIRADTPATPFEEPVSFAADSVEIVVLLVLAALLGLLAGFLLWRWRRRLGVTQAEWATQQALDVDAADARREKTDRLAEANADLQSRVVALSNRLERAEQGGANYAMVGWSGSTGEDDVPPPSPAATGGPTDAAGGVDAVTIDITDAAVARRELEAELEASAERNRLHIETVAALEERVGELQTQAAEAGSLRARIAELSTQAADTTALRTRIRELRAEAEEAEELRRRVAELQPLRTRVDELEAAQVEALDLQDRLAQLDIELVEAAENEQRAHQLEIELASARGLQDRVDELESEIVRLRDFEVEARNLQMASSRIGELEEALARSEAEKAAALDQAARGRDAAAAASQVPALRAQLREFDDAHQRSSALERRLIDAENERAATAAELATLRRENDELTEANAHAGRRLLAAEAQAGRVPALEAHVREIQRSHDQADLLRARIAELEASLPTSSTGPSGEPARQGDSGVADDLRMIKGIGPKLEATLHRLDVTTFRQIAELSADEIDALQAKLPEFPGRIRRDDWQRQAAELHEELVVQRRDPREVRRERYANPFRRQ